MLLTNSTFAKSILNPTAAARLAQFKQRVSRPVAGDSSAIPKAASGSPLHPSRANTQLPISVSQIYGTVSDNDVGPLENCRKRDRRRFAYVELGTCQIEPLPENLPEGTEIEVTITYDEQARVPSRVRQSACDRAGGVRPKSSGRRILLSVH